MPSRSVQVFHAGSVDEAVAALAEHGDAAKLIAGGTALAIMLSNRMISPDYLVSLGRVEGLSHLRYEPGTGLRIGALRTIREVELSPLVRERYPTLASTMGKVANVRIRHAATVGGNLCEADYASDPPCVLVGLRALVRVEGPRGAREIPLTAFFKDFYETVIEPDEVLTELVVPPPSTGTRSAYIKYVTRSSEDRPCVGTAAFVEVDQDGVCQDLRVVVGAVAETPQEIPPAEAMAHGERLTDELVREVAARYAEAIEPLADLRGSASYRKRMIGVFVRRAIHAALGGGAAADQPTPSGASSHGRPR